MSIPSKDNGVPGKYQRPGKGEIAGCGMQFAYAIMGMLFLAGLILYLVVRYNSAQWPPEGYPGLPSGLWFSTLVLLLSSATLALAHASASSGRTALLKISMALTFLLGLAFLVLQCLNWVELWRSVGPLLADQAPKPLADLAPGVLPANPGFYVSLFYILTGLHAAHVLGGVIWLCTSALATLRGYYLPTRLGGLGALSQYWHFLDVVWIVLFATLLLTT